MTKQTEQKSASGKEIAQAITALPPLPATAQEILTCFGDEFIDADKVAEVVEGDPGICAKLLGVANSAYFGLPDPVNSIRDAISRVLGVETVRSLVLAMALQRSFSSSSCKAFDATRFWTQALLTAESCKKIAAIDVEATNIDRDLAYSTGLCHNLGLMALAHMAPERTNSVLMASREKPESGSLSNMLIDEFDADHRIVTLELARLWSLPQPMVAAYQYRAYAETESDDRLELITAAGAAVVGNTEVGDDHQTSLEHWAEAFGLSSEDLQNLAILGERKKESVKSLVGNMTA